MCLSAFVCVCVCVAVCVCLWVCKCVFVPCMLSVGVEPVLSALTRLAARSRDMRRGLEDNLCGYKYVYTYIPVYIYMYRVKESIYTLMLIGT